MLSPRRDGSGEQRSPNNHLELETESCFWNMYSCPGLHPLPGFRLKPAGVSKSPASERGRKKGGFESLLPVPDRRDFFLQTADRVGFSQHHSHLQGLTEKGLCWRTLPTGSRSLVPCRCQRSDANRQTGLTGLNKEAVKVCRRPSLNWFTVKDNNAGRHNQVSTILTGNLEPAVSRSARSRGILETLC